MKSVIKNILKVLLIMSIILIMVLGGVIGATVYKKWEADLVESGKGKIVTGLISKDSETVKQECVTCLFLGKDKGGALTDFIMLGQYNPNTKKISLLSIPRDTRINGSSDGKINSLYAGRYQEKTIAKVEEITGIKIQHYVVFSTKILRDIVDCLGGVTIDVPQNMNYDDPYQDLHIHLTKGTQLLNGDKAEQFVRFRSYVNGDVDRIKAQQSFIKAMLGEVLSAKGISKINDMVKIVLDGTKTDITMELVTKYLDDVVYLKTENLVIDTLPGAGRMGPSPYGGELSYFYHDTEKTKVVVDKLFHDIDVSADSSGDVVETIGKLEETSHVEEQQDEQNTKTRLEVLNANNTTKVLNRVVEVLNNGEFDVVKIGNYPTTKLENSRIVDYGKGTEEELKALKDILKITNVEKQEDSSSKVKYTIIIGEKYELR